MTTTAVAVPPLSIELSAKDRHAILENVLAALQKRFYSPEKLNGDWQTAVERHRQMIESAANADAFEQGISDLLAELHTSHLGFFHSSARRASSRAALSATYLDDKTEYGKRWIFQDVHAGGAAAIADIEPGNILLSVDGRDIVPPEHPVFPMGKQTRVEFIDNHDKQRNVPIDVAQPKGKKLHFIEPTLVEARLLGDGLGYLKVAMFPGMVGVVVANEISKAVEQLGSLKSLIIDLRGNTGGRNRRSPRDEPAHAKSDPSRVRPRQAPRYGQSRIRETSIPAVLADSFIHEDALASRVAICSRDDGEEAHRSSI